MVKWLGVGRKKYKLRGGGYLQDLNIPISARWGEGMCFELFGEVIDLVVMVFFFGVWIMNENKHTELVKLWICFMNI